MGRDVSTDLQNLLDLASCRTDTTLDLILADASELHFATDSFTANGNDYTGDLRAGGEIKQAISASTDRLQCTLQNIDKAIGLSVAAEDLVNAEAIVGRYYRDPQSALPAVWVELFRGRAMPLTVDEVGVAIEIINDLAASGFCVGHWPLSENCVFVFKHAGTCGYAGGETACNKKRKSPDGCFGRDNEHRFGGMEFPDVQAVEVGTGGTGGSGGGWGSCFTGGTRVELDDRLELTFESIYRLRKTMIGRRIKSFDDSNRIRPDVIIEVFRHWVLEYLEVKFSGDHKPTGVTKEHRFWLTDLREFRPIGKLNVGDCVYDHDGQRWQAAVIESVKRVEVPAGIWVYNLTTRDHHRYFADRKGVSNSKSPDDL